VTPNQIQLARDSLRKVVSIRDQAVGIFQGRLLEIALEARPVFKADMKKLSAKLMAALTAVVKGLEDLDVILPVAADLDRGHVD
jgi:nitric oxide dioxygenase